MSDPETNYWMKRWLDLEQRDRAFYQALRQLSAEYEPRDSAQAIDRRCMFDYIKAGNRNNARLFATISGIPRERIEAIEALIY